MLCRIQARTHFILRYHVFGSFHIDSATGMIYGSDGYELTDSPGDYKCLQNSSFTADGINDADDWENLQNALHELGFSQSVLMHRYVTRMRCNTINYGTVEPYSHLKLSPGMPRNVFSRRWVTTFVKL